jgi:glycosyltransferase involved in cell wall biosynthesis
MNVLHFSNKPAYPRIDGGAIAISQLLLSLLSNKDIHVTHYTLSTQKHPFDLTAYPAQIPKEEIHNFSIDTSLSLTGALTSIIKNESYNVSRFYVQTVAEEIEKKLENESFDYVILESIFLLPYAQIFKKHNTKIIVRTHNIEHHIWEHQAITCAQPIKKIYLKKLAKQLKKYELTALQMADGIMAISQEDVNFIKHSLPLVPIEIIPTSFPTQTIENNYTLDDFYFLGAMDWLPNREGVDWLKHQVIPLLSMKADVHIAGKNLTCETYFNTQFKCHGEIESAAQFIQEHGICLIPIQSGSGIKIKLLESMAMGKPIITTTEGARGVLVEHNKHVLIADSPEQFAQAMLELKTDENKRIQLGKAARSFVIDNFGEEKISNRIFEFIRSI